jgi:hypothetical protein
MAGNDQLEALVARLEKAVTSLEGKAGGAGGGSSVSSGGSSGPKLGESLRALITKQATQIQPPEGFKGGSECFLGML